MAGRYGRRRVDEVRSQPYGTSRQSRPRGLLGPPSDVAAVIAHGLKVVLGEVHVLVVEKDGKPVDHITPEARSAPPIPEDGGEQCQKRTRPLAGTGSRRRRSAQPLPSTANARLRARFTTDPAEAATPDYDTLYGAGARYASGNQTRPAAPDPRPSGVAVAVRTERGPNTKEAGKKISRGGPR
jgi:hypothetical protein